MDREGNVVEIDSGVSGILSLVVRIEHNHDGRHRRTRHRHVDGLDPRRRLVCATGGKGHSAGKDVDPAVVNPLGIQPHGALGLHIPDAGGVGVHSNHVVAVDRDRKIVRLFNANAGSSSNLTARCSGPLRAKITAV